MTTSTILVLSKFFRNSSQFEVLGRDFDLLCLDDLSAGTISANAVYETLDPANVVVAIMGDQLCGADEMGRFPNLKTIARFGTGYNAVDIDAALERGIVVTRVSSTSAGPVSDCALFALGALQMRMVESHARLIHFEDWAGSRLQNGSLSDIIVGVVGLGAIGRALVQKLSMLGIETLVWNRSESPAVEEIFALPCVSRAFSITDLVDTSDAAVFSLALTGETEGIVSRELIGRMQGMLLVNVGRGALVDEDALADALESGHLGGAALDVFVGEPDPFTTDSFLRLRRLAREGKNILLTGHIANLGAATAEKTAAKVVENIRAVLEGRLDDAEVVLPR